MKDKKDYFPVGIYLVKVNNSNTIASRETRSKLKIKTPERDNWPVAIGVVQVSLLLTLKILYTFF